MQVLGVTVRSGERGGKEKEKRRERRGEEEEGVSMYRHWRLRGPRGYAP